VPFLQLRYFFCQCKKIHLFPATIIHTHVEKYNHQNIIGQSMTNFYQKKFLSQRAGLTKTSIYGEVYSGAFSPRADAL